MPPEQLPHMWQSKRLGYPIAAVLNGDMYLIKLNLTVKGGQTMRLWHEALDLRLPRQQLLGQHRECCRPPGLGWERHATVNYVFEHPVWVAWLEYHFKVMQEVLNRGYHQTLPGLIQPILARPVSAMRIQN